MYFLLPHTQHLVILHSSHPLTPSLLHTLPPLTPSPVLAPSSSPSSSSEELSSPITRPTPVDRMERPETLATRTRPIGSKLSSRRGWGEGGGREGEGWTAPCEEIGRCNNAPHDHLLHPSSKIYRNSLFVRCKNIFGHRKRTKIFYTNIILQRKFLRVGWLLATHQYFPNCCCPCILVIVVASNTTSCLLFTSHLFSTLCDLLN